MHSLRRQIRGRRVAQGQLPSMRSEDAIEEVEVVVEQPVVVETDRDDDDGQCCEDDSVRRPEPVELCGLQAEVPDLERRSGSLASAGDAWRKQR